MKTQNPWMGRFKGSAGNMTGCKVYDKNVLRAKAFEVSNPNTPAQQNQRTYFKSLSGLVATFTDDELRSLFPQKPKSMSRRNALAKQLGTDTTTVDNQKVIDFDNIDTLGNARTMDFGTTTVLVVRDIVQVSLDSSVINNTNINMFDFVVAIVNVNKGEIFLNSTCAAVELGTVEIALPSGWENTDTINAIPLVMDSKGGAISTQGFGTLSVLTRPARKK